MTITISVNSSAGVNINYGASNYLDTINDNFDSMTGRFGFFNNSFVNASQYGLATTDDADAGTTIDDGNAFIAGGNMTYNLTTNTLSGSIDTLTFGENLNGVTSTVPGTTSTSMSTGTTAFTISSLGITGTTQTDNTHAILYNLMNGNEAALETYLASQSVIFQGNNGNDAFQGGSQADTLNGGAGADTLAGGGGNDTIDAGVGADSIIGGAGADTLTGGDDADTFIYLGVGESGIGAGNYDTITFFDAGVGGSTVDKFNLDALNLTGFSGGGAAAANKAWYSGGFLYADTTNDTTADFAVAITSLSGTLNAADFIF
jgi:Ca2+-binding RTX toxin-like protein